MKKKLAIIVSLLILLTGCSAKDKGDETNKGKGGDTGAEIITGENSEGETEEPQEEEKKTHFENYKEACEYLSEEGTKLVNLLDSLGIKYKKSSNNQYIISSSSDYEMYSQTYLQKFKYSKSIKGYSKDENSILFELKKQYHIQDKISSEDSYLQLFYNVLKQYDNSYDIEGLVQDINDAIENKSNLTFYDGEDGIINLNVYDRAYEINADIKSRFSFEPVENVTSEFDTVEAFYNKNNDYYKEYDEYSEKYSDSKYVKVPLGKKSSYSIYYSQDETGELRESYSVHLDYTPKKGNSTESEEDLYKELPDDVKSVIPQFFDIVSKHAGINLEDYITQEQFIGQINEMMLKRLENEYLSEDTFIGIPYFESSPSENMEVSFSPYYSYEVDPFRDASESIVITIKKPVIAEGKTIL